MKRFMLTLALCSAAGCGTAPTTPSVVVSLPAPTPPSKPVGQARVVLSNFTITVLPTYSAEVRFLVMETSGLSGATIQAVTVSSSRESDRTDASCWRQPIRLEAGSTLNVFDAGSKSLSYCAPYFDGAVSDSDPTLSVTVAFVDDSGVSDSVSAVGPVIIRPR
jgi:hypothetical protein